MPLVRVHNFAISLDGFGTGEGQSADAHFGHVGERLHELDVRDAVVGARWHSQFPKGPREARTGSPRSVTPA